jgi:hypothetical protein
MKTGSPYKDTFLAIAEDYRKILSEQGEAFMDRIANRKSVRDILLTVYSILREAGRLVPIEELCAEEKQELWGEAVKRCEATDKETRIQVCKALHAMGTWCQIQNKTL